jgi:hypothetical protein
MTVRRTEAEEPVETRNVRKGRPMAMRHDTQAVASNGKGMKSDDFTPPLNGLSRSVVELPLLVLSGEAAALEAAADERGLTVAQFARHLIRDFLGSTSGPRTPAAVIRTRYGRQLFETKEEFISFQRGCAHSSASWVHSGCHESFVCERCWAVLEVGWPDHHPEISRWLNEGGAATR